MRSGSSWSLIDTYTETLLNVQMMNEFIETTSVVRYSMQGIFIFQCAGA